MAEIKIPAEKRTEFGKGAARRVRRDHKVPGVLYEHGIDPIHVSLPGHELMLALKNPNALLTIDLGEETHLAIPKQVQRDVLKGFIKHVDLLIVKKGEKVVVEVPITLVGDPAPDTLIVTDLTTASLEVEATHIPSEVEVSIAGLDVGAQILAENLILPTGAALAMDADLLIVNVTAAPTADELEADTETPEADEEVADAAAPEAEAEESDDE